MNINRSTPKKVLFADLIAGDCFIYDYHLFIKVSNNANELNAFNCDDDELVDLANSTLVSPINIELTEV